MNADDFVRRLENPAARERFSLVLYLALMVALVVPLAVMAGQAWDTVGYSRLAIMGFLDILGISLAEFGTIALGGLLGLISLMLLDPKKRWQGILLGIGTVVGLLALGSLGMFITVIDFSSNLHWLLLGGIIGAAVGALPLIRKLDTSDPYEFRWAAHLIFLIVGVIFIISYMEFHITYGTDGGSSLGINLNSIFLNTISLVLFLGVMWRFIKYDSNVDLFVVGPRQSGKSLLLIASFIEAKKKQRDKSKLAKTPLSPSGDLMKQLRELDNAEEGWGVQATDIPRRLKFNYVHGSLVPTNMEVSTIDYPGEILPELPEALSSDGGSLIQAVTDGGTDESDDSEQDRFTYTGRRERDSEETEYGVSRGSSTTDDSDNAGNTDSTYNPTYGEEDGATETDAVSDSSTDTSYGSDDTSYGGSSYQASKGETVDTLTERIRKADTLVLLLDVGKFLNSEDMGLEHYFEILRETGRKQVILVATKCDYFVDEFVEKEDVFPDEDFGRFKKYVNRRLQSNEQINTLVLETGGKDIHPVYYHTKETQEGERVPIRDEADDIDSFELDSSRTTLEDSVSMEESGNVKTVGFDRLLDRLGE